MTRENRQRLKYIVSDLVTTNIAFFTFSIVRHAFIKAYLRSEIERLVDFLTSTVVVAEQVLFPLGMMGIYWLSGFYQDSFYRSRLQVISNTALSAIIGSMFFFLTAMLDDTMPMRRLNYELVAIFTALLFFVVAIGRWIIATSGARKIHSREWAIPTLIVGTSSRAADFASRLDNLRKAMGFQIVGYVALDDRAVDVNGRPVFMLGELEDVCHREKIGALILVPGDSHEFDRPGLLGQLMGLDIPLLLKPEFGAGLSPGLPRFSNVAGEPLIDISRPGVSPAMLNVKRLVDIVVASVALVVFSPLLAAVALGVKFDSRGPVLYRQRRLGYHRRPFTIYKFRSMHTDAEQAGPALSSSDDPRVTRIGRVLRKYRLDELPNFWNVVRGDMSLVGPRPERAHYVRQLIERDPHYALLHTVRPGITSWGMVKYGYAQNVDEMVERMKYDLLYVENMSIGVDMKILFYTVHTVITGRGV